MGAADGLSVDVVQSSPIPLNATFDCEPGEILALSGPSGSGKTTLLRAIAGLYRPASGRIVCRGHCWFDSTQDVHLRAQQRSVGLVFQNYALFPHLNAEQNVAAALGHLPANARPARARALLAQVHLDGLEKRLPQELSGGQQQRVAVARALARDPDVLLLDEPFSAVDRVTRHKLHRELAELRRDLDMPVILVTHDLEEASMLADRLCILHHGRTLQTAPPYELLARPVNREVARLTDSRNVFQGIVSADGHLQWHNHELEIETDNALAFSAGTVVDWIIPQSHIVLHRRDRPSRGEHENPVSGRVRALLMLGDTTAVTMAVDDAADDALHFNVPTHSAERNMLAVDSAIGVSLLSRGIHLMPVLNASSNPANRSDKLTEAEES